MQELMTINVPKIFDGVCQLKSYYPVKNGYSYLTHYLCLDCNTDFWIDRKPSNSWCASREYVRCPVCGKPLFVVQPTAAYEETPEALPVSARLKLFELKDSIAVRVRYRTVRFLYEEAKQKHSFGWRTEELRFNVRSRFSYLTIKENGHKQSIQITNPLNEKFFSESFLKYLNPRSYAKNEQKQIASFLAMTRKAVGEKFQAANGYPIKYLYVSCASETGYLYYPLLNIAYRVKNDDMKNLPKVFAEANYYTEKFSRLKERLASLGLDTEEDHKVLESFFTRPTLRNENAVAKLLAAFRVSNTPYNRRAVLKDIFSVGALRLAQEFTGNIDYQHTLFEELGDQRYNLRETYRELRACRDVGISEQKIMRLLRTAKEGKDSYLFNDILRLAAKLKARGVALIRCGKFNIHELHDRMVEVHDRVKYQNAPLTISEEAKQRLRMQLGTVKFFLPKTTWELRDGGRSFHNCVATYVDLINNGRCQIVFMADEQGFLTACLEVKNGALVQAKLRFNKPVSEDKGVQDSIVAWCKKTGLAIKTQDICTEQADSQTVVA